MRYIDLRSDTVTTPTEDMYQAMMCAQVGDDVYRDDPTVNRLEELASGLIGKEAALFVPTGTMGNQLAVMTHTHSGDEFIAGWGSHIVEAEAGAAARLHGVSHSAVDNPDQIIYPEDIRGRIRPDNIHYPRTTLLCLENALSNGRVVPMEIMEEDYQVAREAGLRVHLDGARLFNAALALKVEARDIAACADSVMFCISKGLCSPVGSLLCGTREFVEQARRNRKVLGGGMRQAGFLAACGLISLSTMTGRLQEDHDNAEYFASLISEIPEVVLHREKRDINMVFCNFNTAVDTAALCGYMMERGIKINSSYDGTYRFITHKDVSREDMQQAGSALAGYFRRRVSGDTEQQQIE